MPLLDTPGARLDMYLHVTPMRSQQAASDAGTPGSLLDYG
jgi:hypothetical protein